MTDLVEWLIKAPSAIYLATDATVADDISPKLKEAANEIKRLRATACDTPRQGGGRAYAWEGPEDLYDKQVIRACKARCKQWGKEDCPRLDHICSECEHDAHVAMSRSHPSITTSGAYPSGLSAMPEGERDAE